MLSKMPSWSNSNRLLTSSRSSSTKSANVSSMSLKKKPCGHGPLKILKLSCQAQRCQLHGSSQLRTEMATLVNLYRTHPQACLITEKTLKTKSRLYRTAMACPTAPARLLTVSEALSSCEGSTKSTMLKKPSSGNRWLTRTTRRASNASI